MIREVVSIVFELTAFAASKVSKTLVPDHPSARPLVVSIDAYEKAIEVGNAWRKRAESDRDRLKQFVEALAGLDLVRIDGMISREGAEEDRAGDPELLVFLIALQLAVSQARDARNVIALNEKKKPLPLAPDERTCGRCKSFDESACEKHEIGLRGYCSHKDSDRAWVGFLQEACPRFDQIDEEREPSIWDGADRPTNLDDVAAVMAGESESE